MNNNSYRKILADNIKRYRLNLGLSQEEFADLTGFHRTYIGSVERCERNVTLSTLETFAIVLKVSIPEILTQRNDNNKTKNC